MMIKALKSERLKVNILLAFIVLFFSQLLCYELKKKLDTGDREVIGQITMQLKDTQRKLSSEVIWETVEITNNIYNMDSLKTSDYSEATVKLKDGTEIKLEENTMVVFSFSDGDLNIDFSRGGLKLNSTGENVKVKSDENNFTLDKAKVSLNKGYGKVVDLNIQDGNVKLNREGKEENLDKNSLIKVKQERVLKKELVARPISPVSEYFTSSGNTKLVEFKWESPNPKSEYLLEVKNVDTSKVVINQSVKSGNISKSIPVGNYRWKLIPKNKEESFSNSSKFAIISDKPVALNLPQKDSRFTFVNSPPPILFRWGKEDFFQKYTLEISKSENFSKIDITKESFADETLINKLDPGKYYFRVKAKPILAGMDDKFSEVRSFELIKAVRPEPVNLVSPINNKEFFKTKNKGYQNTFVWKKVRDFKSYEIQISKNPDFTEIIKKETVSDHYYYLKEELASGKYFWKIRGNFGSEKIDSEIRSFFMAGSGKIKLISPIDNQELEFGSLEFSWVDIMPGTQYTLELSKDKSFSKNTKKIISVKNFISIPSPGSGKYFWRVKVDNTETSINLRNEVGEFQIKPEPVPVILFPKNGSSVDLSPVSELKFEWKKLVEAISYNIEIYSFLKGRKILIKKEMRENYYSISDLKLLKRGDYEILVQARIFRKGEEFVTRQVKSRFEIILSQISTKEDVKFITPEEVYVE